jgi:NAD+ kinase
MKKISIYNSFIKNNEKKREHLANRLKQSGFYTSRNGELLIVIGGDGTFLSAVRKRMKQNPIFVGFNAGNLGFFSEFRMEDAEYFINILKNGNYWIQEYPVYEAIFKTKNGEERDFFVNDLVVERKSTRIIHSKVQLDNENLGIVSGDGMIVSTALGSTAYNLSAGGAVIFGYNDFLQVTPVSSVYSSAYHSLVQPVITKDDKEITIFPNVKKKRAFRVVCDGKELKPESPIQYIEVKKTKYKVRIMRSKKFQPLAHLRNKIFNQE